MSREGNGWSPERRRIFRRELRRLYGDTEGLLIARDGEILWEEYFRGRRETLRGTASMFKSLILTTALGVLIRQGVLPSEALSLGEIFSREMEDEPGLAPFAAVSLREILTHTTGIRWPGPKDEGAYDWSRLSLLAELEREEGSRGIFRYKPDSHILIWAVEKLSGRPFLRFVEEEIFTPLGIGRYDFAEPASLSLTARDVWAFGRLYLHGGRWEGRALLDEAFTARALSFQNPGGFPEDRPYGYLWWLTKTAGMPSFYAGGFGGQYLYVVPEERTIFVIFSDGKRPRPEYKGIVRLFREIGESEESSMGKDPLAWDVNKKKGLVDAIKEYVEEEWDQSIGDLKAEFLLDFVKDLVGKELYNRGVEEAKAFLLKRMEDTEIDMDQLRL